jgi:tRNA threonylcarbamoyladenosine biosynthesis protein TsaB
VNILSIDTSGFYCSISILTKDKELSAHSEAKNSQSKVILDDINDLLDQSQLSINDIDYIIYGAGPGSFTGVRLALSIAKGLSIAHNIKAIGLSSTLVIAYEAFVRFKANDVSIYQDARKSEIFFARYKISNGIIEVVNTDQIIKPNFIVLENNEEHICGSGIGLIDKAIIRDGIDAIDISTPNALYQAKLAQLLITRSEIYKFSFEGPNYIRNDVTG